MGAIGKVKKWLTPEGLTLLEGWAREGLNDKQIANKMRVHVSTYYDYKNKFPEFSEAIKKGKEIADFEVENALFKRARGYTYLETTKEIREGELVITKTVVKEVAPDVGAIVFWLKNRKPKKWQDKDRDNSKEVISNEQSENKSFINALNSKAQEVWKDNEEE